MKICPVCDRPAEELVGQDDVLMCPRCAAAVEVEPSLRHLDAGSWKDTESPPEEDRRPGFPGGFWSLGLAALLGIALLAVIWAASGRRAPSRIGPIAGEGTPSPPEPDRRSDWLPPVPPSDPPAPPPRKEAPPEPPPVGPRERAREMLQEAVKRISALVDPFGRGPGDVRKRVEEAVEVEHLLGMAALMAPDLPDLAFTQGKLFALMGRLDAAYAAYGRALEADGGRLEARVGQAWVLVTAQLAAEAERDAYPRLAAACRKRIAERYGNPVPAPPGNEEADRLQRAIQGIAHGDLELSRSQLEGLSRGPGWLASEIPGMVEALSDLGPAGWRGPPPPPRRGGPGGREAGPFEADRRIARRLSSFAARLQGRRAPPMPEAVTPHTAALRIDAALLAEAGKHGEALEKLELALAAAPEDLFTRLDRAGALARLGRGEEASREYDAASRLAAAQGFPPAVAGEIAALRARAR